LEELKLNFVVAMGQIMEYGCLKDKRFGAIDGGKRTFSDQTQEVRYVREIILVEEKSQILGELRQGACHLFKGRFDQGG